ncbi:phosphoribosylaminoimidazole carboxylase, ATPase subunit [Salinarchaeum sp. Harcht-Bsk1]|uniref:5-(carboxyamino)imidazole ribonucleotide synthase n=1 Tax=Salinarchaeum sp. Harcht-Bsk1 TaxID=1333523 RepID=UPI0003424555|nr:5-(carboxyamino)imidazole ribonucleotide synthase [Salinarchaeum sp. Harcht-Bsk1]AGN00725.1 phosphoribosylaminoimidazole carboxylase, ATPase subunit [Salinarchaeum sp. Harcht-Bsk1]
MTTSLTPPGRTLGIVGGGQLGRMLAEAASPLGVEVIVLDPTPDCPASSVARDQLVADFDDADAIAELAERSDALTFEIELTDPEGLERAAEEAGVPVHPKPDTLRTIEDKLVQKRSLRDAGIPVPEFREVDDADDLRAAIDDLGASLMLKARTGGYDGRGNFPVESAADAERAMEEIGGPAMAERFVDFERELSVIGVAGAEATDAFPAGENVHREEILRETVAPARADDAVLEEAQSVAADVLELLEGRGVYGIELFEHSEPREDGARITVNEIAPRPHNSGHWTIEGAITSQFENHVRAVLGLPLGNTDVRSPTVMANLLGDSDRARPIAQESVGDTPDAVPVRGVDDLLATGGAHLHWYGKREVRPLRKLGHVTLTGDGTGIEDRGELLDLVRDLRDDVTFS